MSAKEMFDKLGYKDISSHKDYIAYQNNKKVVIYTIIFVKEYNCIELMPTLNTDERQPIHFTRLDMKLLQAINKQVEELGWNE